MTTPTLINIPPPPSDPVTPSDMPGTPTSTTTSMSELSTVAIKDGHRGHPHHHPNPLYPHVSSAKGSTQDAERADRISRLAGLEPVATMRQASNSSLPVGASASHPQGYFDAPMMPLKERSTVGSASATGSVGGRQTWASGSDHDATDKMSEDMETSSTGGFSDEGNTSLVGFGETASSSVSGPVSSALPPGAAGKAPQRSAGAGSPFQAKVSAVPQYLRASDGGFAPHGRDPKTIDGMTYDSTVADTTNATPPLAPHAGDGGAGYEADDVSMSNVSVSGSAGEGY